MYSLGKSELTASELHNARTNPRVIEALHRYNIEASRSERHSALDMLGMELGSDELRIRVIARKDEILRGSHFIH